MRHFILAVAIAAHPFGVCDTVVAAVLVAFASLAHAGVARKLRAVAFAIDLVAVATATNNDPQPAAGAYKQSIQRQHWQSLGSGSSGTVMGFFR
ncbi:hypothetical protein [Paraburkholderia aromaticivorans]|uniref:hypothetical protein n=1 Tax=Paraburkholderia aromaticivorans TaxID=2026199 RepID=UPI0014562756|nr:hypothetical protein [Paraburkholderia aromaticivorans]